MTNAVLTDRKDIADSLQDQFCSAFSNPNDPSKNIPSNLNPSVTLSDVSFSVDDILEATDEIDANSSCPDFCIPAVVLKKCKLLLCTPLFIMSQESFKSGAVPALYKNQLITPVYKKDQNLQTIVLCP